MPRGRGGAPAWLLRPVKGRQWASGRDVGHGKGSPQPGRCGCRASPRRVPTLPRLWARLWARLFEIVATCRHGVALWQRGPGAGRARPLPLTPAATPHLLHHPLDAVPCPLDVLPRLAAQRLQHEHAAGLVVCYRILAIYRLPCCQLPVLCTGTVGVRRAGVRAGTGFSGRARPYAGSVVATSTGSCATLQDEQGSRLFPQAARAAVDRVNGCAPATTAASLLRRNLACSSHARTSAWASSGRASVIGTSLIHDSFAAISLAA